MPCTMVLSWVSYRQESSTWFPSSLYTTPSPASRTVIQLPTIPTTTTFSVSVSLTGCGGGGSKHSLAQQHSRLFKIWCMHYDTSTPAMLKLTCHPGSKCQNSFNALWHRFSVGGMQHHSSTRNSIIWCFVDGGRKHCLGRRSRISHKCSIGLRSAGWDGHGIWFTLFSCSSNHSVTARALWMGALSSYGGIAMVAKIMACPAFLYMTLREVGG